MAGKSAVLSVRIIADAAKAVAGFKDAEGAVGGFQSKMDKIGDITGKAAGAASIASAAWLGFAKQTVDSASDMEQAAGAVGAVFGDQADQVMKLADGAAQAVGLSASEYANMSALMGSQLQNLGFETDQVAEQTNTLISLGADMAAMYGGTTSEAVSALSSLLRGERDPIERYAVSMNQAAIDAEMAARGLDGLEGAAKRNAEAQVTMDLVMEQSANALGTFARESETVAGQQQRAAAEWENAKAILGEQLLPIVTKGAQLLGELAAEIAKHPELFKVAGGAVLGLTSALVGIHTGTKAVNAASDAFKLLNGVMKANTFGLVVTAVAAVAGGLMYAYENSETFRNAVHDAADLGKAVFGKIADWVSSLSDEMAWLIDKVRSLIDWLGNAWNWAKDVGGAVSDLMFWSAPGPELTGQLTTNIMKFLPPSPDLTMAAAPPDITASLAAFNGFNPPSTGTPRPSVHYTINVDGALDAERTAEQIKNLLDRYNSRQGWA